MTKSPEAMAREMAEAVNGLGVKVSTEILLQHVAPLAGRMERLEKLEKHLRDASVRLKCAIDPEQDCPRLVYRIRSGKEPLKCECTNCSAFYEYKQALAALKEGGGQ